MYEEKQKQSGAAEACWAHNPEVRRSKLRSANDTHCFNGSQNFNVINLKFLQIVGHIVPIESLENKIR